MSSLDEEQLTEEILTPDEAQRARRYQMRRLWLGLADSLIEFAVTAAFLVSVPTDWWPRPGGSLALAGAIYFAALSIVRRVVTVPIDYYASYRMAHEVGLSTESLGGWVADRVKGLALSLILGGAVAGGLVWLMAQWPRDWWWIAALLGTALAALLSLIAPVLLAPLFFKFKPLENPALRERLEALLERTRARVRGGVWEMDMSRRTRAANAALVGWGPSRRVVLSDTLLAHTDDEIEAILAHEIAHHVGHHLWLMIGGRGILLAVGLYLADGALGILSGRAGIPSLAPGSVEAIAALWLLLSVWGAVLSPLVLAISRKLEYGCDHFAVRHASKGEAMASALTKLCRKNLADPAPPGWVVALFHSHPPPRARVRRVLDASRV